MSNTLPDLQQTRADALAAGEANVVADIDKAIADLGVQQQVLPAWLAGKPTMTWMQVLLTKQRDTMDWTPQFNAGLSSMTGGNVNYGFPDSGILAYSGGSIKKSGSEMIVFGGGGAGAWGGNDVRGLMLGEDVPKWRTRVNPTNKSALWPHSTTGHPYMQNGDPNGRHSYWQPIFNDAQDALYAFGCANVIESDNGNFNNVDSAPFATGVWTQAGAHPPIPYTRGVGGSPNCKDPRDERVYCATYATAERFDGTTNSWTRVIDRSQLGESAQDVAIMGIDTVHNKLFRLGLTGTGGYLTPGTMDLTSLAYTRVATLVGPYASTFPVGSPNAYIGGAGLCFDPGLGKFLLYRAYGDDGFIYTFEYVSDLQWRCDRLTLAGTPPPIDQSASRGYFLGGSMQYCQELGGFAIIKRADLNVYFVKTV